jgi:hypothetical protein
LADVSELLRHIHTSHSEDGGVEMEDEYRNLVLSIEHVIFPAHLPHAGRGSRQLKGTALPARQDGIYASRGQIIGRVG